jgi:UDP-glucose 4-epimerase
MKILVLGGSGFIGTHVVDGLIENGFDVRVFDRNSLSAFANLEFVRANFDDLMSLSEALVDIDLVVHLVSTSVPSTSNSDPVSDINGNLVNTVRLLELMRKNNVNNLVYFSSGGTVYGHPTTEIMDETHPNSPVCSYGIVKLAIEKYLYMYSELYGVKSCVLRPSNPYGSGQKRMGVQGFIGTCISHAMNGTTLNIWGDGSVIRDYVHVSDVVSATVAAVKIMPSSTYNISSGVGYSLNEIIQIVEQVTNKKVHTEYKDGRKFDIPKMILNNQKAFKELSWQPQINIQEGIAESISSYMMTN